MIEYIANSPEEFTLINIITTAKSALPARYFFASTKFIATDPTILPMKAAPQYNPSIWPATVSSNPPMASSAK